MTAIRLPVLVCEDFAGLFTAVLVESNVSATGEDARRAVAHLKDYLVWEAKRRPWVIPDGDFAEPEIMRFSVKVRPEYQVLSRHASPGKPGAIGLSEDDGFDDPETKRRVYPCDEPIHLPVPAVLGQQTGGMAVCSLPLLDLRFFFHDKKAVKGLVTHYVQRFFRGATPADVARFLPPKTVALDEIIVRIPSRVRGMNVEFDRVQETAKVAEPIGDNAVRRRYSRAFERDAAIDDLARRIGKDRANVVVVGPSGAGKTAVIVDTASRLERAGDDARYRREDADENERRQVRRHWMTSAPRLIAGMKYLGQWEQRCESIIEELQDIEGVLVIENLLDLVLAGGEGPGDSLAAFFAPFLAHGQLQMVVEATPDELDACRRLLPGFADLFQVMRLPEFERQQALAVLDRLAAAQVRDSRVEIRPGVTNLIYRLFARFMPYQTFPGKASAFVGEIFEFAQNEGLEAITPETVVARFVQNTGLPEKFLRDELPISRGEVVTTFQRDVIGQDRACAMAADLVTTFKAGLNDPARPLGVLLFCGPTGVGKTSLARAISKFFFEHGKRKERLIRLDMSEYSGPDAVDRLVGGSGKTPSELIRRVREQPFCVVLFDEIEKASPDVFDMLLGLMDEGRLADRFGRTTIFRSAVIIMTSNLGADQQETVGYGTQPAGTYDAAVMRFFRPEFYNRIDAVVTFDALGAESIRHITEKELREIAEREGLQSADLKLEWSARLVAHLAAAGFDPLYGARPLQRALESLVVTPLARFLVANPGLSRRVISLDLADGAGAPVTIAHRPR